MKNEMKEYNSQWTMLFERLAARSPMKNLIDGVPQALDGGVDRLAVRQPTRSEMKKNKDNALAYGEITGHMHQADVDVYEDKTGLRAFSGPAIITHEEHKPVKIPAKEYRSGQVVEWNYLEQRVRNVVEWNYLEPRERNVVD